MKKNKKSPLAKALPGKYETNKKLLYSLIVLLFASSFVLFLITTEKFGPDKAEAFERRINNTVLK